MNEVPVSVPNQVIPKPVPKGKKGKFDDWQPTPDMFGVEDMFEAPRAKAQVVEEKYEGDEYRLVSAKTDPLKRMAAKQVGVFTPTGEIRSDAEMIGIQKKKIEYRQAKAREKEATRNAKDKMRTLETQKARLLKYTEDRFSVAEEVEITEEVLPQKKVATVSVKQARKDENQMIRAFNAKMKKAKKARKVQNSIESEEKLSPISSREEISARRAEKRARRRDKQRESLEVKAEADENESESALEVTGESYFTRRVSQIAGFYLKNDLMNGLKALGLAVDVEIINFIEMCLRCIAFLHLSAQVKTKAARRALHYMYFSTFSFNCYQRLNLMVSFEIMDWVFGKKKNDAEPVEVTAEALSDYFADASSMVDGAISSQVSQTILKAIAAFTAFHVFPKDVAKNINMWVPPLRDTPTVPDLIKMSLEAIACILRSGELIASGVPIGEALSGRDPVYDAMKKAKHLLMFKNATYEGLPQHGYMDLKSYVHEGEHCQRILKVAWDKMNPFARDGAEVGKIYTELSMDLLSKNTKVRGQTRMCPYAILVHGKPGVGKSKILTLIANLWSEIKGREHLDAYIYERCTTSTYFEAYSPLSQPIMHYSELGATKSTITGRVGDPAVTELLSIIDSRPFSCDMAFAEKGSVFACPELVLVDSNSADLGMPHFMNAPEANLRRFLFIEPRVKDRYRIDGGCGIDPAKCNDGSRFLDRYEFHVYRRIPNHNRPGTFEVSQLQPDKRDVDALSDFLREDFVRHIKKEESMKKSEDAIDSRSYGAHAMMEEKVDVKAEAWEDVVFSTPFFLKCKSFVKGFTNNSLNVFSDASGFVMMSILCAIVSDEERSFIRRDFVAFCIGSLFSAILHALGYNSIGLILMLLVIFDVRAITNVVVRSQLVTLKKQYRGGLSVSWQNFKAFFGYDKPLFVRSQDVARYAMCVGIAGVALTGVWLVCSKWIKKLVDGEASSFFEESEHNADIADVEEKTEAGNSIKRVHVKNMNMWNEVRSATVVKHTSDGDSFRNKIARNSLRCLIYDQHGKERSSYLFGVCGNYALVNTHALGVDDELVIKFSVSSKENVVPQYAESILRRSDIYNIGQDLSLIKLSSRTFADIIAHFPVDDVYPDFAEAMIGKDSVTSYKFKKEITIVFKDTKTVVPLSFRYKWADHKPGMCGLPLMQQRANGWIIGGLHCAGEEEYGYAVPITQQTLLEAISHLKNDILFELSSEGEGRLLVSPECFERDTDEPRVVIREVVECEADEVLPEIGNDFPVEEELEPISRKSALRYEDMTGIRIFGKYPGSVLVHQKSRLKKSFLYNDLPMLFFDVYGHIPTVRFCPPIMQPCVRDGEYLSPVNYALRKMAGGVKGLDRDILRRIVTEVSDRIVLGLKKSGITQLKPLDMDTAINGVDTDAFMRRIAANKSAGFGYKGPKAGYIPLVDDVKREPIARLKQRLVSYLKRYRNGGTCMPIFKAHLKDEPRDVRKVAVGKTRLFYATPLCFLILSKMYLSPFYTLMISHKDLFYTAIGANMHMDSDDMFRRMKEFSDMSLEGDHEGFDIRNLSDIAWAAGSILHEVVRQLGYNETALQIVRGLLTDNMFPVLEVWLDIICKVGLQPSGKYATAEDNSVRLLVMIMYVFYKSAPNPDVCFFDHVLPLTYGDDLWASIKASAQDWFNNHTYAAGCKQYFGMVFTASDKSDNLEQLVPTDKVSFLKRTFAIHSTLGKYVGKLDMDSIYKTLEWRMPSDALSEMDQCLMIVSSSLAELYFHSTELQFNQMREALMRLFCINFKVDEEVVSPQVPTWAKLTDRYSGVITVTDEKQCRDFDEVDENISYFVYAESFEGKETPLSVSRDNAFAPLSRGVNSNQWLADPVLRRLRLEYKLAVKKYNAVTFLMKCVENDHPGESAAEAAVNEQIRDILPEKLRFVRLDMQDAASALSMYESALVEDEFVVHAEADEGYVSGGTVAGDVMVTHENVQDMGGTRTNEVKVGYDYGADVLKSTPLDPIGFFERPIELGNLVLDLETDVDYTVNLFDAYLKDPTIRAKLRNYAYIRGDMNVRVAISGTPFHSGRLLLAWLPCSGRHDIAQFWVTNSESILRPLKLSYLTQTYGRRIVDVKINEPVHMVIPYVSNQPVIRLFLPNNNVLGSGDSLPDAVAMGTFHVHTLNQVRVATTGTSASVNIQMWMTNVKLGCPTGTVMEVKAEADERVAGPVEVFSTGAHQVASALTQVPFLQPFANAAKMAFGAMKILSAYFGWSVPTVIDKPVRMKNEPYQNMANTIGFDTGQRITMDPKQGLSVDSCVVAVQEDEMALAHICGISSYISTFMWHVEDVPAGPAIYRLAVTPGLVNYASQVGSGTMMQPSALAFAAQAFDYWHGSITYKFQFVTNQFHRGKIAIVYEPNVYQASRISSRFKYNEQYMLIVDLQETQEVEVCVNWASFRPWLRIGDCSDWWKNTNNTVSDDDPDTCNGFLLVFPITALQSPEEVPVEINVYAHSDDMKFNAPSETNLRKNSRYLSAFEVKAEAAEDSVTCFDLNPISQDETHLNERHFGEAVFSFRSLLKRFFSTELSNGGNCVFWTLQRDIYPRIVLPLGSLVEYTTLYDHLRMAYLAYKGGVRKRIRLMSMTGRPMNSLHVSLDGLSDEFVPGGPSSGNVLSPAPRLNGTAEFVPTTNGGSEVEIPFYTNNLFAYSGIQDPFPTNPGDGYGRRHYTIVYDNQSAEAMGYTIETATAEDFSFMRWMGAPFYSNIELS